VEIVFQVYSVEIVIGNLDEITKIWLRNGYAHDASAEYLSDECSLSIAR